MAQFLSLAEAVEDVLRDGDTVAMEGFTHLIPSRGRPRGDPPGPQAPDPGADDAGPHLRPADRHGLRRQAHLLLGRQSRRRLAAPLARRGRERLAAAARARGAFPRRHGQCLRGRRRRPALRGLPRLHRRRPAEGQPEHPRITCPFTGEELAAVPALRPDVGDHPRAQGRPRRQRAARRHRRRAEGGGAGGQALDRHGRGDRRRFRAAQRQRRDPADLDGQRRSPACRAARIRPTRTATTSATTPSTRPGTRSRASATRSSPG